MPQNPVTVKLRINGTTCVRYDVLYQMDVMHKHLGTCDRATVNFGEPRKRGRDV